MMLNRINWSCIETVLLDMDGTILDLHYDNHFWLHVIPKVYAEKNDIALAEAKQRLHFKFKTYQSTLNWYCLDFWTEELQLDIPKLKTQTQEKIRFRSDAEGFLQFLQEQEKRVVMATNAHRKTLEIKQLNAQFHHYFERLISSHDYGYPKEHPGFWLALESDLDFDKTKTLFIDDSLSVLNSANDYGIAFLLGVAQPDSKQPSRTMKPYHALESFSEIMPREESEIAL